ncbi:MAG: polysaccharide biosynthesis protein [Nocardioidaceae bacterium]
MPRPSLSSFLRGSGSIAIAMAVMSVSTYGFTVIAAHILGPQPYGALAGLMNTLLIVGVVQLGLQATAARRISAEPEHVSQIEAAIVRVTTRSAWALGGLLLVLSPVLDRILRLESIPTAALIGVTAVPMTVMGGQAGILQGERRWLPLSLVYIAAGVPRLVLGTLLMIWWPNELAAMVGVTIASFAPVVVGWWALRGGHEPGALSAEHRSAAVIKETAHNSQALLAFFALSNVDIIVARNVLTPHQAGLYAGGLILAKAVLFLPQFVVVIAFPSMSTLESRRRALVQSLALVAALGAVSSVAAWLLSSWALLFVGGSQYADIQDRLWMYAVLGTALSMLQLLVYSVIARRGHLSTYGLWLGLAVLVGVGLTIHRLNQLLSLVVAVDLVLCAALLFVSMARLREPAGAPAGSPPAS